MLDQEPQLKLRWPALRVPNFRRFLVGQTLSLLSNSIQQVGLLWLIYRTSHSSMVLGVMAFVGSVPAAVVSPLAGVFADRTNPLRIATITQFLYMVQAFLLAALAYCNRIDGWEVISLICLLGFLNGVDMPMRQILIPQLLHRRQEIGNGVALNAMVYDGTRMLGPLLGGLIVAHFAEGPSFIANGLGHFVVLLLFLSIRLSPQPIAGKQGTVLQDLSLGVRYAAGFWAVRSIFLLSACVSFAGSAYMVLLPIVAEDVLGGGARGLGLLMSSIGVGAVSGGVYFSLRRNTAGQATLIGIGAGIFGTGLFLLSLSHALLAASMAMGLVGFGIMIMMAACNTTLIEITEAGKQGRVLSLFTLSYLAVAPIGSLCMGFLASHIGAAQTIALSSVLCLLAALQFSFRAPHIENLLAHSGGNHHLLR